MKRSLLFVGVVSLVAVVIGCNGDDVEAEDDVGIEDATDDDTWTAPEGTTLRFDPNGGDFFDLPFPDDTRVDGDDFDGVFSSWPDSQQQSLLEVWFDAGDRLLDGWGVSSGLFAYFDDPVDPDTLPTDADDSVDFDDTHPSVFLVDVDPDSPDQGQPLPITCQFRNDPGSYHPEFQLGCITPFGTTRRPATRYALVITDDVADLDGDPVVADEAMARLLRGEDVSAGDRTISSTPYTDALDVIDERGVDADSVSSIVLATTTDPSERLRRVAAWYRDRPTPEIDDDPGLSVVDTYGEFVVLEATYDVPVIQQGERPYDNPPDGQILFDDDGVPEMVDEQNIRFYLTVPRQSIPDDGYPTLLYLHGSGGVAEQLLHRGPEGEDGTDAPEGSGPGGVVAPYGIAGFAADFNLHGMRHSPPDATGLKLYNILDNPAAAVDNFIVAAGEIHLHARLLETLEFDVDSVDGLSDEMPDDVDTVSFDGDALAAMGQSMGSTIGLPALTVDDTIDAGIFAGAGGLLIEVALESTEPIPVGDTLKATLDYDSGEELDRYDPILSAVQQIWDLVDPVAHGRFLVDEPHDGIEPTHGFQPSGLEDAYFSTESRAAFSTAIGAQLVEPVLEAEALDQMRWRNLDDELTAPVTGNRDGTTSVVQQYEPDVLHGHHVAFQRDDTKSQYACFIHSLTDTETPTFYAADESGVDACVGD